MNRYKLNNDQVPSNSIYVPEPMEAGLLDVFETVNTLVSALGYPVFEPLASQSPSSITFFCRGGGSEGRGELVEDGFVILAGSKARMEVVASATASVTPKREALLAAGVLEERNGDYYFIQRSNRLIPVLEAGLNRNWFECRKQASESVMGRDAMGELEVLL